MHDYYKEAAQLHAKWLADNGLKSCRHDLAWQDGYLVTVVTRTRLDGTVEMFNDDTKQMIIPH